jgi:Tfp pilus assembly protein PilX
MPHDAQGERGWVLVTAISLLAIMMLVALATVSIVDTQQKRTRQQRERESSLNLAETALYEQGFKLGSGWPATSAVAAPDCSSTAVTTGCPTNTQVVSNSTNIDTQAGTTWTTMVRDNGGQLANAWQAAYADSTQSGTVSGVAYSCGPCNYDANGDKKVWVRAQAIVRGRKRTVVATMRLEKLGESVPESAVVAGGINTTNSGNQKKIYAIGSQVVVRCNPGTSDCVSDQTAIQPAASQGNPGPMMTPDQIERFKQRAIADKTYYSGCPPQSGNKFDVTGAVVFVNNCTDYNAQLAYTNGDNATCRNVLPPMPTQGGNGLAPDCVNAVGAPGLLIWHCGALGASGVGTYVGVIYFPNSSENVFAMNGGMGVLGAVAIDGNGCFYAGSNGIQVQYDPNAWGAATSYGTVGLVQDTWRELIPN